MAHCHFPVIIFQSLQSYSHQHTTFYPYIRTGHHLSIIPQLCQQRICLFIPSTLKVYSYFGEIDKPVIYPEFNIFIRSIFHPLCNIGSISSVQAASGLKCIYIGKEILSFLFFSLFLYSIQNLKSLLWLSVLQMQPCQYTISNKALLNFSSCFRLHSALCRKRCHLVIISALFKKALRQSKIYKTFSVFSKYKLNNPANLRRQLSVSLAPLTEIFSTIHH